MFQSCETAFKACVESGDVSSASQRVKTFESCMAETKFASLGCAADCSPTYNMMITSEVPTTAEFDTFGQAAALGAKPSTSICNSN